LDARTIEGLVWICAMSLPATLAMVIVVLTSGNSMLRHPQGTRYLVIAMSMPFLSPAWWLIIGGAWQPAYDQLGDWWSIPVIGWLVVIGFWCSVVSPLLVILAVMCVKLMPAQRYPRRY
jgi:hypothetical protein